MLWSCGRYDVISGGRSGKLPVSRIFFRLGFLRDWLTLECQGPSLIPLPAIVPSLPVRPSVFRVGRDRVRLIVRIFRGSRTDYAREREDRTDCRGL